MCGGVHGDVDAELHRGLGLVGAGERMFAALPARLDVERAVDDANVAVDADAFEVRRFEVGTFLENGGRVLRLGDFEDGTEQRMARRNRLERGRRGALAA